MDWTRRLLAFVYLTFFPVLAYGVDGCLNSDPRPAAPSVGAEVATIQVTRYGGESFTATIWRTQCPSGVPRIWLRLVPTSGSPFVCYLNFTLIVHGAQYDAGFLTDPANGSSTFCDDLYVPTTVLLAYVSGKPQYDRQAAITFIYDNVTQGDVTTTLPAFGAGGVTSLAPETGVWWNPSESGTGYVVAVKNNVLVMQIYSYRSDGEPQWYLTAGPLTNGNRNYSGTLDKYRGGQCITCATWKSPTMLGNDGPISIVFNSNISATVTFPGGRVSNIVPFVF